MDCTADLLLLFMGQDYLWDSEEQHREWNVMYIICFAHTTLLLALPAVRVRQVLRPQVGSSEWKVQGVFVISLDISVISSN